MATIAKGSSEPRRVHNELIEPLHAAPNYCSLVKIPDRVFSPDVGVRRSELIVISERKWINGTILHYYFYCDRDGSPSGWAGSDAEKDVVRKAFNTWKQLGIGLSFQEVSDRNDAEIRIGFKTGDGSWSYVGRDAIDHVRSANERTMNFGWNITQEPDTALHEIGHALGAPHEHQNPNAGIVWNEEVVFRSLAQPPNLWDRDTTFHNIIRKIPIEEVEGSTHDPDSIMHYPFGPGLILSPEEFVDGINPKGGLSEKDKAFVKKFYPPIVESEVVSLKEADPYPLHLESSEQKNFEFLPTRSKKYRIETLGQMDTVMVVFEKEGEDYRYLAGNDDSGTNENSKIEIRLLKGRKYAIRLRMYYGEYTSSGVLMVF